MAGLSGMEKMDLALTGPTRFKPTEPAPNKAGRLVWLIIGSVLFHIAVLATLSFQPPAVPPVKSSPIKAAVYTPVRHLPPKPETNEKSQPAPVVAEAADPNAQSSEEPPSAQQPSPPAQPETNVNTNNQPSAPTPGEILMQAEDSPAPPSRRLSDAISRGIAGQQLQQQYDLAEEVSRQRREEHISPDLKIGEYEPPQKVVGEYAVNCEKGVNSTVATVARLFGGNVKCNQRNEFQRFIDKRQHKQPEQ